MITFETHPDRYRHWNLAFDGPVATLSMDVREDAGIKPDYKLKLNSYDLGVDIELNDALQRLRQSNPRVTEQGLAVNTRYYTIDGTVTYGVARLTARALVRREPNKLEILWMKELG